MILIIAGMQRSASTFSFNVAREILNARGGVSCLATNSLKELLEIPSETEHFVIKTHAPDLGTNKLLEEGKLLCICTIRKPEDAIYSWMTAFNSPLEETIKLYVEWLRWHHGVSNRLLNISYSEIDTKPLFVILKIGQYLVRDFGLGEAAKIWWKYRKSLVYKTVQQLEPVEGKTVDIGFSYYDKNTFFHRRHVSTLKSVTAESALSQKDLDKIRYTLRDFVDEDGDYEW